MRQKQQLFNVDEDSTLATFVPDENNGKKSLKRVKKLIKRPVKFGPKKEPKARPPKVPGQLHKKRGRPPKSKTEEDYENGAAAAFDSNIFDPVYSEVEYVPSPIMEPFRETVKTELVNWPIMSSELAAAAAAVNGPIETVATDILNWPMVAATELLYRQIMEESPEIQNFEQIEKVSSCVQLLLPSPSPSPPPQQTPPSSSTIPDLIKVRNPCENFDLEKCTSARVHLERLDETKWPSSMLMDLFHGDHNYSQNDLQCHEIENGSTYCSSSSSSSNSNSEYMDTVTMISYNENFMDFDIINDDEPLGTQDIKRVVEEGNGDFYPNLIQTDRPVVVDDDDHLCVEKFESKNKISNNNNNNYNAQPQQNNVISYSQPKTTFLTPPPPPPVPVARKNSIDPESSPSPEKRWYTLSIAGYPAVQAIVVDHSGASCPVMVTSAQDEDKENLIFSNGMLTCQIIPASLPCHYAEPERIKKKEQKEEKLNVIYNEEEKVVTGNGDMDLNRVHEKEKVIEKKKTEELIVTSHKKDEVMPKNDDESQIDDDADFDDDEDMEMTTSEESDDDEETESETETRNMYDYKDEDEKKEKEKVIVKVKEEKKEKVKVIVSPVRRKEKPPNVKEDKVEKQKKEEKQEKSTTAVVAAVVETRLQRRSKNKAKIQVGKITRPRKRKGSKLSLLEEDRFVCVLCRDNHGMLKTFKNRNTLYNHRSVYHRNGDDSPALTSLRRRKNKVEKTGRRRRRRQAQSAA